jgi:hypothetical protein
MDTGTLGTKAKHSLNAAFGYPSTRYGLGHRLAAIGLTAAKVPYLVLGTSSVPVTLATYANHVLDIYSTCASTDGSNSVEPIYMKSTMTGAGGVGGRARFHLYANVALGGWANALKGFTEFGSSGKVSGLASAICAEIQLSAGCTAAAYAALEAEIVMPTSAVTGERTSFLYCNVSGATASTFDTYGYFLHVGDGITAAAGKFCSASYQSLKCYFTDGATTRYIPLSQIESGLGLGSSSADLTLTAGTPLFQLYTTCSSTSGSTSAEPFLVKSTMTGAAGVGGRAKFHLYTNVALGGWANALKGYTEFGASGRITGLASAICAEIVLSAGCSQGTYAALEAEIVAGAGAAGGSGVAFLYCNASDAGSVVNSAAGYFAILDTGITDTAGGVVEAEIVASCASTHKLKVKVLGVDMWIPLNTAKDA